jgi:Peptidase M66
MLSVPRPRLGTFPRKTSSVFAGALAVFSWGCSGTIETSSENDGVLPYESAGAEEAGAFLSATPLSAGDQVGGFCGDEGVRVGRVPTPTSVLEEVSLYQSVEISLTQPDAIKVQVVAGRETLVRVFVAPHEATPDGARLTLHQPNGKSWVFEEWGELSRQSEKGDLASTYNFHLEGKYIDTNTTLSVELFRLADCDVDIPQQRPARFPERGAYSLSAREVGALQLVIVPIRYWADGSGRQPDVSEEHLNELRAHLGAMFPVPDVELQVHDEVDTTSASLEEILGQVMQLRASENPAPQVGYFGLVNPNDTMDDYCGTSCVAGVSAVGSSSGHSSSGVAVGYRGATAETFIHELGHMHRLEHAPCGDPAGAATDFPHPDARIGVWGYDRRSQRLIDPAGDARDFMGYCDPAWISDVNTQSLIERIALSNSQVHADIVNWQPKSDFGASPQR